MAWMTILGLDWQGGKFSHPMDIVDVPQKPGVFKIHTREESGEWEVTYVGQASNLYMTLLAYLGTVVDGNAEAAGISSCAKKHMARAAEVSVSYAVVEDAHDRDGCVRSLYEYFKPETNRPEHVPDVTDVGCNPF